MRRSILAVALVLIFLGLFRPGVLHAQLADDVDAPFEELEEVMVIGEKDKKPLSATLASVAVVDDRRIDKYRLYSVADAFRQMANVQAPQFTDGGFVIRGINTEAPDAENISGSQVPMALIYIDGVALSRGAGRRGPLGIWDVAQVEVFRGPQTSLQGRNSLAGAVHIHTKNPTFDWEGASRSTVGSFETYDQALMLSGPLSDTLAFRLTAEGNRAGSFIDYPNLVSQPRYNDLVHAESYNIRGKLLWQPGGRDDDTLTFLLSYNHSFGRGTPSDVFGPNAPGAPAGLSFYDRQWLSAAPGQQIRATHSDVASLLVNWRPDGSSWRFVSQSAFVHSLTNIDTLNGGFVRDDVEREYTHELRAHYETDRTRAVLGLYGFLAGFDSTQRAIESERLNLAAFGEIDQRLAGGLHSIIGARLDYDEFEIAALGTPEVGSNYLRLLPKGALRYEFTPDHSLAFTVQRGYRAGGAATDVSNIPYTFAPATTMNYELALRSKWFGGRLETNLNAFHTKLKNQQVVLRDFDFLSFTPSERVINAANSEMSGIELETRLQATEELAFFVSAGYLDTNYTRFVHNIDPVTAGVLGVPAQLDYSGYDFPESPRWNAAVGFDYRRKGGFFLTADAEFMGEYYSPYLFAPAGSGVGAATSVQVPQDDSVRIQPRAIVNASVGYEWKNWTVTLFVRNLFDRDYLIGQTPNIIGTGAGVQSQGGFLGTVGAPRFIGVAVNVKF